MTAQQPLTRSRLRAALAAHGVTATEEMLTDVIAACKRASSAPEAIQILQTYGGRPEKIFWEWLANEITDLALWERVVSGWAAKGYKMMNVADMLAMYKRGQVPQVRGDALTQQPRSMNAALEFMRDNGLDVAQANGGHD